MRRKASFSLLEIIIVLMVLGISLGAFSLSAPLLFSNYAFKQEVEQLKGRIHHALSLSENFQIPIEVHLLHKEGAISYQMHPLATCSPKWKKSFSKKGVIRGVENLTYNGKTTKELFIQFNGGFGDLPASSIKIKGKRLCEEISLEGYTGE
jgi:Tfp pilus assembly protein PilE